MNQEMFTSLLNMIGFLAIKEDRTKSETLAYNHFLDYAGSIARYNRVIVEEELSRKLDEEYPDVNNNSRSTARTS